MLTLSTLNQIFIRPETQAGRVIFRTKRQLVSSSHGFGPDDYDEDIPSTLTSIEEARKALEYIRIVGSQVPRICFRMGEDDLRNSTETIRTITAPFSTQLFV